MQINNPLQMNDWEIRKILKVVVAIQLALWGVIGLDATGIQIPILREFIGFIYLTFIPGILILRILKLHKLGNIETLLYTVGLSIATLMFTGLFMNVIYPFFGISGPISIIPLIITISILVAILCILSYVRDKDFSEPRFIDVKDISSLPALFLCLIPFLAIFGTYLVNFYHNNIILMFLIVILALIVILIAFDKFIPKNLYPLAVFIIAISLLFHRSLISMYLWGYDIQIEYYLSNLVIANSLWDSTLLSTINAMLSIIMLAPIFSNICSMSLTWVFKIIFPSLFSLVPLGLYRVFQKQTDDRIAFLSCFFFMSLSTFYVAMLTLARQEIAELFLVLLILLMIDKDMDKMKRSFLWIIFGISLAVSHYGLSYLYMFYLISAWLILVLAENPKMQGLRNNFYSKFGRKREKLAGNPKSLKIEDRTISSTFVLFFITFTLAWYMYVSSSSAFDAVVHTGDHIASNIYTDFLSPRGSEALNILLHETVSPLHEVSKILHHITQFFIVVGVIELLFRREKLNLCTEYFAFSIVAFMSYFGIVALPYGGFGTARLYHITFIFMAPFCVIGGITTFRMLAKVVRTSWTSQNVRSSLKVLSVLFAIFLLFNSGFVYEVANDHPTSISLNSTIDYPRFNGQEVSTAEWLKDKKDTYTKIYSDEYRGLLLTSMNMLRHGVFMGDEERTTRIPDNVYIFFGRENVKNGKIILIVPTPPRAVRKSVNLQNLTLYNTLLNMNRIYNNGDAQVYYR